MDMLSKTGSGKIAVFTTVKDKLPTRTLSTIDKFCDTLIKNNEDFFLWAQKDGGVQVEFVYGIAPKAKGETKFFLEVDGEFQNIEDTSDGLSSIQFPWHKVDSNTRCKVVIALTPTFLGCSEGPQMAALLHEYFVHGVYYKKFIEFIHANKNLY